MAVGVACAGTGMRSAADLLAPLLTDAVDFVRQGALISTALVLMQQPEAKVRTRHLQSSRADLPLSVCVVLSIDGSGVSGGL